ncbi:hypothetical protein BT96DRAFT_947873 [Gymnopus androsaceus JB14]|uniref:Uncharacterized protein n=1 Tax=Gymnopus androsaceus JB14 TaxID=1447944 RepID=A0A6A4GSD9_9AGAR|nr:hypothetical protein BT96DRAFT_947873 [Gymnopus androsaceus JB14]
MKRCLNGKLLNEEVDGLMQSSSILLFLGPACDFPDKALKALIDDSSKARYAAAHTLNAFASAKLAHNLTYTQKGSHELSRVVHKFLEADRVVLLLPKILESACQVTPVVFDGEGLQWAAVVMASSIVLIDYPIFDSRAMRTIKDRLWDIAEHKGRVVRRLSGPVMPAEKDKAKEREMARKVQTFLSQDYRSGTGAETCPSRTRACASADRNSNPTPTHTPTRFDTNAILHSHLNGNILKSDLPSLHEYTRRHKADVRPLSVQETINHWDELYDFWMVGVGLVLRDSALLEIPKYILTAWQTLLLAYSEFSQSQGFHLALSPKLTPLHATFEFSGENPRLHQDLS